MIEDKFKTTRISTVSLERLQARAVKNHRSVPNEIDFIIEQVEAMEAAGVKQVQVLPGPKGSQKVPVVYVQKVTE